MSTQAELSSKDTEKIQDAIQDYLDASTVTITSISESENEQEFEVLFVERHLTPKLRSGKAVVKVTDSVESVKIQETGFWFS